MDDLFNAEWFKELIERLQQVFTKLLIKLGLKIVL